MRKKIIMAALLASTVFSASCSVGSQSDEAVEKTVFAMDTAVSFKGSSQDAEMAEEILYRLDSLFDRYSEESDIYAINNRMSCDISEDTENIIISACELSELYGSDVSIFGGNITDCWNINSENPTVPSDEEIEAALDSFRKASFSLETMSFADENGSIDIGSVAKGYAMDKIYEELDSDSYYIVSANSSILLNGEKPDGEPFIVSLRDPESDGTLGTIRTEACFLSTSGGYERYFEADGCRYSHIFDLNTGRPSETDLTSVTVICDSGIKSDFLSTLIYLEGTARLGEYLDDETLKIVAVTENREICLSDGIDFELNEDSSYTIKEADNE
ncbi:MAG: FAD:protein FMN transferase [Ruminococcus sp.]|nr:FAD:protein FMN transferase [Ruminococcus sp.]